ncbi:MAG TPA: oligosaccharide flippase family protein, partial [Methanobacteriaceae archaeon]|nr:oligosaccharide flippase family protein [Methanobacteriaceae archaeon]
MTVIIFSLDKFQSDWLLYYFTFGLVLGNLLLPTWFFQGMEKMRYISILNIGISLIYTAAIFIFVRQPADYTYVPLISALGTIIIGVYSLRLVKRQFGVGFTRPSREDIRYQLEEGWYVFISTVAISLYTISGTFILGFFASNTIVGYFSVAYRIISIANGLLSPISQSIYPYISSLAVKSREEAIYFIKKTTTIMGALSLLVSFLIFIFAGLILYI